MVVRRGVVVAAAQILGLAALATVPDTILARRRVEVLRLVVTEGVVVGGLIVTRAGGDAKIFPDAVGNHHADAAARIAPVDTTATRKEAHV